MTRYSSAFALLAWALFWASVPPLVMAAFFLSDRLRIPFPFVEDAFLDAWFFLIYFAERACAVFLFFAAVDAVVVYIWGRIEARRQQAKRP